MKTKKVKGALPQRKWISRDEACAFLDMSLSCFKQNVLPKLTASTIGNKIYYKVSELENILEENTFIKQTA